MAEFTPRFNALFRNGHLTKEVDLGLSIDEVKKLDKKFFGEGFRMRFLYRFNDDGSYQVAWEKGSGAQFWLDTDDFDELSSTDEKHFENGVRLKYLHSSEGHFTAIWHPGSGSQIWKANINFNEFKAKDEELKSKGFMLMQFCDQGGKYSGFWQPGKKKYSWISTSHIDGFNEAVTLNKIEGRLGVAFGGEQFCVVFHEEMGDQKFVHGLNEKDFASECEAFFKQGLHIVDLYMTLGT